MNRLIDYAGLFPPASLNLAQAFNNFVVYIQSENKWVLSRFIIPAKRLGELSDLMNEITITDIVLPFSILASGGNNSEEFKVNLAGDINNIIEFKKKHGNKITTDVFELRLPADIFENDSADEIQKLLDFTADSLRKEINTKFCIYYEASFAKDYNVSVINLAEAIAHHNKHGNLAGFKLRTGGTESSAFPSSEQIAFAIMTCCEFCVPMKFTAGLHHPVRHFNEELGAKMHGFINVFGAGILAYICDLDEDEIVEILNEEDPFAFRFDENGFSWEDFAASDAEIKKSREKFVISYGSCSFDEPIDDLKTLELL